MEPKTKGQTIARVQSPFIGGQAFGVIRRDLGYSRKSPGTTSLRVTQLEMLGAMT